MIYYLTVHWKSDRWIDVQHEMIRRYTDAPYKIYAYLTGIERLHYQKFDVVIDQDDPPHDMKLDALAKQVMVDGAKDNDWLIFIDGDAFPITGPYKILSPLLVTHQLIAVRRLENLGEKQPHPCFCVTTVALWNKILGSWSKGYKWVSSVDLATTDVGGDLLEILEKNRVNWWALERSNTINLNAVFYAIYGNIVYHHGSGFRQLGCRQIYYDAGMFEIYKRLDARILNNIVPKKYQKTVRDSLIHPEGRMKRRIHRLLAPQELEIYSRIKADPEYVRTLIT